MSFCLVGIQILTYICPIKLKKQEKMTATENRLVVIQRQVGTVNEIRFTWDEDLQNADFVAMGIEDEDLDELLDRMMLVGAHEGNDYPGWEVEIK